MSAKRPRVKTRTILVIEGPDPNRLEFNVEISRPERSAMFAIGRWRFMFRRVACAPTMSDGGAGYATFTLSRGEDDYEPGPATAYDGFVAVD